MMKGQQSPIGIIRRVEINKLGRDGGVSTGGGSFSQRRVPTGWMGVKRNWDEPMMRPEWTW